MSFILDALKKLEKEKESPGEPGVVMVGPVQWGGADPRRWRRRLALAAAAVVLVLAVGIWWRSVSPGSTAPGTEGREATPGGGPSEPSGATPAGETPSGLGPSGLPAEEVPTSRATEAPEPAPGRAAAARPPRSRTLDFPGDETTPPADDTDPTLEETTRAAIGTDLAAGPGPASSAPVAAVPEFRLTAISTRDGEPIALLNDRLVREGDRFGDVHVIRIGTTEIEIEVDGQRRTIGF